MISLALSMTLLTMFTPSDPGSLEFTILSESDVEFQEEYWYIPQPDSIRQHQNGMILVFLSDIYKGNGIDLYPRSWALEMYEGVVSTYQTGPGDRPVIRFDRDPGEIDQIMTVMSAPEDTLWSIRLTALDEYDNSIQAYILGNGDIYLVSHPDCWSSFTYTARVSSEGDIIWATSIGTSDLIDVLRGESECKPGIRSVRETLDGDLMICGSVSQWVTSSDAMYLALLDGESGELEWSVTHAGLGEAEALDMALVGGDTIIVVGTTSETDHPKSCYEANIWSEEIVPLVVALTLEGDILGTAVVENSFAFEFTGVLSHGAGEEELFILGKTGSTPVLLRASVTIE